MIQALNSVNTTANCCGSKRKQSFGDNAQEPVEKAVGTFEPSAKRPSKAKRLAAYVAAEFAAGAIPVV